ncbi:AAA family ATPase [Photobacterium leiognathi]|uniref:AAA family ATPase n=1 Tax=Photobacterium leiognathi TaxID=553611 RepID=UPI001EDD8589|nr:AAA family ATPase [Photobacterium leiognathi]MCG3885824.1 AAA family ATPase [Photobacterium leiognathi]
MSSSYIEKLHLSHFRQFKTLDVEFNHRFNFISGPNGCGKTSILAGISHCFNQYSLDFTRFNSNSEFWTDLNLDGKKVRTGLGKGSFTGSSYRSNSSDVYNPPIAEENRIAIPTYQSESRLDGFCPLFIGAERSIKYKKIVGMTRESERQQQIHGYTRKGTELLYGLNDSYNIKQWFINRYFIIDKDWATVEKENWNHMIEFLPTLAPFDSNFSYIRIGRDLEPVFSLYGQECYLEELSAGFQAILFIIANIFEWIEATREEGERLVKDASGTVLIDELDIHLHPEWQFTLRDGLSNIFPQLQFIVTTHSPHLLSSAKENEIIIMQRHHDKNEYSLKPSSKRYSGWNTDQILSEVMGVVSIENKEYEQLIVAALNKMEEGKIQEFRYAIDALSKVAHPNDSILTVLNTKYASMVALSND